MTVIIPVGRPAEDARFLLSGLSRPNFQSFFSIQAEALAQMAGKTSRSADQVFRLILPANSARITLTLLSAGEPNVIKAYFDGVPAGEMPLPANLWTDFEASVPGVRNDRRIVELRLERDPYGTPTRQVLLTKIEIEVAGTELSGDFNIRRIITEPVRNRDAYFASHEIRKLSGLQPGRAPGSYAYSGEVGIYFGDIHVHTNYSVCGRPLNGDMEENARIAKDRGLDFIAFADHAEHMDAGTWRRYFEAMDEIQEKVG
ncbi:MAG: hypothetical protein FWE55_05945, partial [Synergistaceae bacterium]|nr:hypothetical protein [Synergistaceae bacterium]